MEREGASERGHRRARRLWRAGTSAETSRGTASAERSAGARADRERLRPHLRVHPCARRGALSRSRRLRGLVALRVGCREQDPGATPALSPRGDVVRARVDLHARRRRRACGHVLRAPGRRVRMRRRSARELRGRRRAREQCRRLRCQRRELPRGQSCRRPRRACVLVRAAMPSWSTGRPLRRNRSGHRVPRRSVRACGLRAGHDL